MAEFDTSVGELYANLSIQITFTFVLFYLVKCFYDIISPYSPWDCFEANI